MARRRPHHRKPATTRSRHLGVTSINLQGIDNAEIINTVRARPAPMITATAGRKTYT
jgi:hypothetical protein